MKQFKDYTNEELDQEFIKYFGEEELDNQKVLAKLEQIITPIVHEYLCLELIPIVFDETLRDNCYGIYSIKENAIFLNPKIKNNKIQLLETLCHELEHYYQLFYVNKFDTPKAKRWTSLFETRNGNEIDELEIDAYAFAQVVLACEFNLKYHHPDNEVQALIYDYIYQNKLLNDD